MKALCGIACLAVAVAFTIGCEGEDASKAMSIAQETHSTWGKSKEAPAKTETPSAEKSAAPTGEAAEEASTDEAQSLIDKATAAINDGKLDQAQQSLTQLESMKGALPQPMQDKIASLQKSLDMAKAAKLPGASPK